MSLLEVTITAGPTAGKRVRVNRSPAPFGRDAGNALVVDLPTVSRVHGELRFEDDRWVIANLSPNGTTVNHRVLGRKPRPLEDGDQVVVGNQPVMTVALRDDAHDDVVMGEAAEVGPAHAVPARAGMTARTKLWLTIAGFWSVVFTLAFIFTGLDAPDPDGNLPAVPVLTDSQIAAAIRAPLPKQEPSPRAAAIHFDEAEAFYQRIAADPRNVFRAYQSYKVALSHTFGGDFNDPRDDWGGKAPAELGIAQKRMLELEASLIDDVSRMYMDAYGKLRDRRNADAQRAFKGVMDLYADAQNPVFRNAERQRDLARRRLEANK